MLAVVVEMHAGPVVLSDRRQDQAPDRLLQLGARHGKHVGLAEISSLAVGQVHLSSQKHPHVETPPPLSLHELPMPAEQVVSTDNRLDIQAIPPSAELVEGCSRYDSLNQSVHWLGHVADLQHAPDSTL